jgi:hypothetical protein
MEKKKREKRGLPSRSEQSRGAQFAAHQQPSTPAQQQPAVQPSPAQHTPSRKYQRQEIVLILFLAWWTARRRAPLLLSAGASSLLDGVTRRALVQYKDPWTNPSLPFFFLCSILLPCRNPGRTTPPLPPAIGAPPSQAEDTIITARLDLVIVQEELRQGDP